MLFRSWDYAADVPLTGGRSIMTIPRELDLVLLDDGYRVRQRPVRELPVDALQHHALAAGDRVVINGVALDYHNGVLSLDRRGVGMNDFHEAFGSRQWAEVPGEPERADGAHQRLPLEPGAFVGRGGGQAARRGHGALFHHPRGA